MSRSAAALLQCDNIRFFTAIAIVLFVVAPMRNKKKDIDSVADIECIMTTSGTISCIFSVAQYSPETVQLHKMGHGIEMDYFNDHNIQGRVRQVN